MIRLPAIAGVPGRQFSAFCLLVIALPACQPTTMRQDRQLQTVGQLIEKNGQRPERLGISLRATPLPEAKDEHSSLRDAITHYEHIIAMTAQPEVRVEALRRAGDLRVDGVQNGLLEEDHLMVALGHYQQVLANYPHYPNRAQVLYQRGRLQAMLSDDAAAIASLEQIAESHGASPLAAQSQFRAAEMLLSRGDYASAARGYGKVISLPQAGEYRLYVRYKRAWALFEMSQFDQALGDIDVVLAGSYVTQPETDGRVQRPALPDFKGTGKSRGIVEDATRLAVLCLAASERQQLDRFLPPGKSPEMAVAIYRKLVDHLLDKERVVDAAEVALHFSSSRPESSEAASFHRRAIAAYLGAGLEAQAVVQKLAFVDRYDIGAAGPTSGGVDPADHPGGGVGADVVMAYMLDVAQYYHRQAKAAAVNDTQRDTDFAAATTMYRRWMVRFPGHADGAEVHQQLADALFDSDQFSSAANEYQRLAFDYPGYGGAAAAGMAAIKSQLAYVDSLAEPTQRLTEIRHMAALSQRISAAFPGHDESAVALLQAARLLFDAKEYGETLVLVEGEELAAVSLSRTEQHQRDLLRGESLFYLSRYAEAESIYRQLLATAPETDDRNRLSSRLAVCLYRQADALRLAGDLKEAAGLLESALMVGSDKALQERGLFDAAAMRFELSQWSLSTELLERYRREFTDSASLVEVDKMLARSYSEQGAQLPAAKAYLRVAENAGNAAETKHQARLKAAQHYQQGGDFQRAISHYRLFLIEASPGLDQAQSIRWRMVGMLPDASALNAPRLQLLADIIEADRTAPQAPDEARYIAAQANLQLAQFNAQRSRRIALVSPLPTSLANKKRETENAIAGLARSAEYGYGDVSSVALNEIGQLYMNFANAILNSERPVDVEGEVLAEYQLLLEEQAYPFEEKAIATFENNLSHVRQGLWNAALQDSLTALAVLVPGRYTKQLRLAGSYDVLR